MKFKLPSNIKHITIIVLGVAIVTLVILGISKLPSQYTNSSKVTNSNVQVDKTVTELDDAKIKDIALSFANILNFRSESCEYYMGEHTTEEYKGWLKAELDLSDGTYTESFIQDFKTVCSQVKSAFNATICLSDIFIEEPLEDDIGYNFPDVIVEPSTTEIFEHEFWVNWEAILGEEEYSSALEEITSSEDMNENDKSAAMESVETLESETLPAEENISVSTSGLISSNYNTLNMVDTESSALTEETAELNSLTEISNTQPETQIMAQSSTDHQVDVNVNSPGVFFDADGKAYIYKKDFRPVYGNYATVIYRGIEYTIPQDYLQGVPPAVDDKKYIFILDRSISNTGIEKSVNGNAITYTVWFKVLQTNNLLKVTFTVTDTVFTALSIQGDFLNEYR